MKKVFVKNELVRFYDYADKDLDQELDNLVESLNTKDVILELSTKGYCEEVKEIKDVSITKAFQMTRFWYSAVVTISVYNVYKDEETFKENLK